MRKVIVSYSQPIKFVRPNSEHARTSVVGPSCRSRFLATSFRGNEVGFLVLTKRIAASGDENDLRFVILFLKIIAMVTGKLILKAFAGLTCKQMLLTTTGSSDN